MHKKASAVIMLILILGGYGIIHSLNGGNQEVRYVLATAGRGTIITSVSGTGQVSASNQVDVSSKTSGNLVYLNATVGQIVNAGTLIAQVDATEAAFELESARLSYQELINADPDDIKDAKTDVENTHVDARTTLISTVSTFIDTLQTIDDILSSSGYLGYEREGRSRIEESYIDTARDSYNNADDSFDGFHDQYKALGNSSVYTDIEALVVSAHDTSLEVLQATKDAKDAVVYVRQRDDEENASAANEAYSSINEAAADVSSVISNLTSARNAINEANKTLQDLNNGPDTLDLRSEELSLHQAEQTYADYFIRAPFTGIIASVSAHKSDAVSNGTTIATLITEQKIAEISLNEVDAAKVKTAQKATLTFDAIEDLTITGEVLEVDLVGTVSQGVVSYNVKIGFDTDDDRVKPGMTVSANIITDMRQDVLMVPTSAIKTQGDITYVEIVDQNDSQSSNDQTTGVLLTAPPEAVQVTVGLSNDESTEILSGLEEGQQYIAQTITQGTTQTSTQAPSLFGTGSRTTGGNFPR